MIAVIGTLFIAYTAFHLLCASVLYFRNRLQCGWRKYLRSRLVVLAPYNLFIQFVSRLPHLPIHSEQSISGLDELERFIEPIRAEAMDLLEKEILQPRRYGDDATIDSFAESGWGTFYLKWYTDLLPSALVHCPESANIVERMSFIRGAMFTVLQANSRIPIHTDPFAGSLRFHFGIDVPDEQSCWMQVGGERVHWRNDKGLLFDHTFEHVVENNSNRPRLILCCDIERPLRLSWAQRLNRFIGDFLVGAIPVWNTVEDQEFLRPPRFGLRAMVRGLGALLKKAG